MTVPRRASSLAAAAPLLLALGCLSPTAPGIEGQWGGTVASMVLTRSGGTLSYQCGAGTVDPSWTFDADGRFAGTGQHFVGGGPIPPQGRPPHPATYAGQVDGNTLTLTVTLNDLGQTIGPFIMFRGGPLVVESCL